MLDGGSVPTEAAEAWLPATAAAKGVDGDGGGGNRGTVVVLDGPPEDDNETWSENEEEAEDEDEEQSAQPRKRMRADTSDSDSAASATGKGAAAPLVFPTSADLLRPNGHGSPAPAGTAAGPASTGRVRRNEQKTPEALAVLQDLLARYPNFDAPDSEKKAAAARTNLTVAKVMSLARAPPPRAPVHADRSPRVLTRFPTRAQPAWRTRFFFILCETDA